MSDPTPHRSIVGPEADSRIRLGGLFIQCGASRTSTGGPRDAGRAPRLRVRWSDVRRLTPADHRAMPWRNGGGTTTEIAISPEGTGLAGARFFYRVSIADVAVDGPFSRFGGYDRHIMLLAGAGMTLDCGAHGRIDLSERFVPRAFPGDWDVRGILVAGVVRDYNVIVDRSRASSTLDVHRLAAPQALACEPGTICIVHVIDGELAEAAAGDTLITEAPFDLVPRGAAHVAIARIVLRQPSVPGHGKPP